MRKYHLYYDYELCGDVLLIIFDYQSNYTHYRRNNDVVLIFNEDKLIGINIFNFKNIVKIVAHGILINPPEQLIDILNNYFSNQAIDVYLPAYTPRYVIGQIKNIIKVNQEWIALIDIGTEQGYAMIEQVHQIQIDEKYVVIVDETILNNGQYFKSFQINDVNISLKLAIQLEITNNNDKSYIKLDNNACIGRNYFL